jgi:hypothetical protein
MQPHRYSLFQMVIPPLLGALNFSFHTATRIIRLVDVVMSRAREEMTVARSGKATSGGGGRFAYVSSTLRRKRTDAHSTA